LCYESDILPKYTVNSVVWGSVVFIATHYRLDGLEFELSSRRYIPHPFKQNLETTEPPVRWVPGISLE